jgi:hypothetical protein
MARLPAKRCLSINELLAQDADGSPPGGITERLDLPESGARGLFATLIEQGWVEKEPRTSFCRQCAGRGLDAHHQALHRGSVASC